MGYNPVDIELLKDSVDIVATIGQYVELKKSGSSWKGLCPFHREKSPSFHVSPERGTWKCFGCDAGGDVISFLERYKALDFLEVIEELAEQNGLELKPSGNTGSTRETKTSVIKLLEETQKFFTGEFKGQSGSEARKYLESRSIDENILRMGIGYAPGGNALLAHLQSKGYSVSSMEEAGVVKTGDRGPYDFFRNRLTFPVRDRRGRVVSFGARALDSEAKAKYLNGPETAVYRKGTFLYGYSRAHKEARSQGRVILVEGYFDHARLLSNGFGETVAASGTAFTEKQARNLMGMADRVLICYDGDSAGRKASVKVAKIILSQGGYAEIIRLPDRMDPDDFILNRGRNEFESLIEQAMDPISFCISLLPGKKLDGYRRVVLAQRLIQVAAAASNPLVEEDLLGKVELFSGFSRTALLKTVEEQFSSAERRDMPLAALLSPGDKSVLRASTAGGKLDRNLIRFLKVEDMLSDTGKNILQELKAQVDMGYSSVMPGEMSQDLAAVCADLSGQLHSVTTDEIQKLKHAIERNRREKPRKKQLLKELETADPVREAEILEDLKDAGGLHDG